MSRQSDSRRMRRLIPLLGVAAVLTVFAGYYPSDPSTAWGALCGGLVAVGLTVLWMARGSRDPGSLERTMRGEADERDRLISLEAGSWTAMAAFATLGLGIIATAWGVEARHVLTATLWLLLAVQFGAHWWLERNR
ncbi:hypothetical protein ACQP1U_09855 [Actinomycetota bacterium]